MTITDAINKVIDKETLFASLVLKLKPVEDKDAPTMGTDGINLFYNQKFLDSITLDEAAGVLLHEIFHCAFRHIWRRGKRNHQKWNIATDYAINAMVNQSFPLPLGALLDSKYQGMSAEQIYDLLPTDKNLQSWCDKDQWEKKKSKKSQSQNNSSSSFSKEVGALKRMLGLGSSYKEDQDAENADGVGNKQLDEEWKDEFEKTIMHSYGKMPATVKRVIEKTVYTPSIDWYPLVQKILSEDIIDYSFSVPDRRYLDGDFVLPDMFSFDRLKDVVFAYDTSGSIDKYQLFTFFMETVSLFNNFISLTGWIAVCDAALHEFKEIRPQGSFDDFQFIGGGGTDFRPVFDKIEADYLNPKALFYFTDCAGSFPQEVPNYPVYWLVNENMTNSTPNVPFGEVIKFKSL